MFAVAQRNIENLERAYGAMDSATAYIGSIKRKRSHAETASSKFFAHEQSHSGKTRTVLYRQTWKMCKLVHEMKTCHANAGPLAPIQVKASDSVASVLLCAGGVRSDSPLNMENSKVKLDCSPMSTVFDTASNRRGQAANPGVMEGAASAFDCKFKPRRPFA